MPERERWGTIRDGQRVGCLSKKRIYELIGSGDVTARKDGRKTIVDLDQVRKWVERLPQGIDPLPKNFIRETRP